MPGRRLNPQLVSGTTPLLVLAVIAEEELYGYEIAQRLRERSGGTFAPSEGTLYPTLHRLELGGALQANWRASDRGSAPPLLPIDRGRAGAARRRDPGMGEPRQGRRRGDERERWVTEPGAPRPGNDSADEFLERVAGRLRMPYSVEQEVIDELRSHIADAADALEAEGLARDEAERKAIATLGAPDALGDDLRRTHQARRRLFAAAGGGVWDGLQEGFGGVIVGALLGGVTLLTIAEIVGKLIGDTATSWAFSPSFSAVYGAVALWVGAWWGARGIVASVSRRSARSVEQVRVPIALVGALVVGLIVALWTTDHSWASVIGLMAAPAVFAIAAGTARDRDGAARPAWYARRPSPRVVLGLFLILGVLATMIITFVPPRVDNPVDSSTCCGTETPSDLGEVEPPPLPPDDVAWQASGYLAVAPTVIGFHQGLWDATRPGADALVSLTMRDDRIDWDEWRGLRAEAWRALPERQDGTSALLPGETEPYVVVPIEPWEDPGAVVPVGSVPGVSAYVLFVTAIDPSTGQRVALGSPDGEDTAFHGNVIGWFIALAT